MSWLAAGLTMLAVGVMLVLAWLAVRVVVAAVDALPFPEELGDDIEQEMAARRAERRGP